MLMKIFFLSIFLFISLAVFSQEKFKISGVLVDENEEPLKAINIFLKNQPTTGVTTDEKGYFEIKLPRGKHTLVVTYLGYSEQEVSLDLSNQAKYLIIKLLPVFDRLNEIS